MISQLLEHIVAGDDAGLAPLTVDQYHQMVASGILGAESKIELLDGLLVLKDRRDRGGKPMNVGPRHAMIVVQLLRVLQRTVESDRFHVRSQLPITLPPANEPEPDAAIVRGHPGDYRDHHPGPAEVVAVMEVADSSLRRDRDTKLGIYATAGVATYWIVNLLSDQIEVYTEPQLDQRQYGRRDIFSGTDVLTQAFADR
jgi:Uma2 family endonuclease